MDSGWIAFRCMELVNSRILEEGWCLAAENPGGGIEAQDRPASSRRPLNGDEITLE